MSTAFPYKQLFVNLPWHGQDSGFRCKVWTKEREAERKKARTEVLLATPVISKQ